MNNIHTTLAEPPTYTGNHVLDRLHHEKKLRDMRLRRAARHVPQDQPIVRVHPVDEDGDLNDLSPQQIAANKISMVSQKTFAELRLKRQVNLELATVELQLKKEGDLAARTGKTKITMKQISLEVCKKYRSVLGVSMKDIFTGIRGNQYTAFVKQEIIYRCNVEAGKPFTEISHFLNNKCHTTSMHAFRTYQNYQKAKAGIGLLSPTKKWAPLKMIIPMEANGQ